MTRISPQYMYSYNNIPGLYNFSELRPSSLVTLITVYNGNKREVNQVQAVVILFSEWMSRYVPGTEKSGWRMLSSTLTETPRWQRKL